ncbi:hypothetical protein SS50377_26525 [Spironucleus salmonicida]|uniref:Uncharacterized protein n=1 Tax=Spironucleus salmonicida TaxID=348837 RepID=V6LAX3_9EUKA|nr:hypothetical protein SS50377_26525 [Spironucleus salmonicida]|eukprot:EST41378.1 Hypothetical protein SS50377_19094 [Spironucleus salmonicida]
MTLKSATNYKSTGQQLQMESLQKQLNYSEKQLQQYKKQLEASQNVDNSFYQNQIKELLQQKNTLQHENSALQNEVEKYTTTISSLNNTANAFPDSVQYYKIQIQDLQQTVTGLKISQNQYQKDNEKLYKTLVSKEKTSFISEQLAQDPKLFKIVSSCTNCNQLKAEINELTSTISQYDEAFKDKKLLLIQLHQGMKQQQSQFSSENKELLEENNNLKAKINKMRLKRIDLEKQFYQYQNDVKNDSSLDKTKVVQDANYVKQLQDTITTQNIELEQNNIEITALKHSSNVTENYQKRNESLKFEVRSLNSQLKSITQMHQQLQRSNKQQQYDFEIQMSILRSELQETRTKLQEARDTSKQARKLQSQDERIYEMQVQLNRGHEETYKQFQFLNEIEQILNTELQEV